MQVMVIGTEPQERMAFASALRAAGFVVAELPLEFVFIAEVGFDHYDAIIISHLPPRADFPQVLSSVRERMHGVPVLAVGNRYGENDIVALLEEGADDAISRPVRHEELVVRVKALIRKSNHVDLPALTVSDLDIDTVERTVICCDRIVDLSPKEYRILEYLARRSRTIVSKRALSRHLYASFADHHSNVIEVHVSNLRTKLRRAGSTSSIEALRLRGYRLRSTEHAATVS